MMKFILPFILLTLSSCATTADSMRSWIGFPKNQLLESWGVPDRTDKLDNGKQVITWDVRNGYGHIICMQTFTIDASGIIEKFSTNCPL